MTILGYSIVSSFEFIESLTPSESIRGKRSDTALPVLRVRTACETVPRTR